MQSHYQSVPEDGRWLAAEGPYRDYIAAWCALNPNLRRPDSKNKWSPLKNGNAHVVMLETEQGREPRRVDFSAAADLSAHLRLSSAENPGRCPSFGRIYIMEGLAPDFIAALGDQFFMDPRFFMDQERTTAWGLSHEGSKQTPSLPSLKDPEKMFALKYYELRDFGTIESFSMWCARTSRGIGVTSNTRSDLYDLKFEPIGILQRKCSFWYRGDERGWVVILCDPPVEHVFVQISERNRDRSIGSKYSNWVPKSPKLRTAINLPFSGGYLDFMKHLELNWSVLKGPPRTSLLEDLCFYWTEHGASLQVTGEPITAATTAVIMQKIVLSHYMQLIEFVQANLSNLEFQLSHRNSLADIHITWIEERWGDLQSWGLRCSEYVKNVEAIMISLGVSFSASLVLESKVAHWTSCEKDFHYIHYQLKLLKTRLDVANNSITGLASIAGNRQALREAKRSLKEAKAVKTLTGLGMVFIPLAFCTGLFSMNDQYLPGTASFWIYFAVSIPLILAVFVAAHLINLGYDSDGGWNWAILFQNIWNRLRKCL